MGDKRLHPDTLKLIPGAFGSILSDHQVIVEHISASELGRRRKGRYRITIVGPAFGGQWGFRSGHLEKLSRAAAKSVTSKMQKGPALRSERIAMIAPPIVWLHLGRKHAAIYRQYVPPFSGGFARRLFYGAGYVLGLVAGPGVQDRNS